MYGFVVWFCGRVGSQPVCMPNNKSVYVQFYTLCYNSEQILVHMHNCNLSRSRFIKHCMVASYLKWSMIIRASVV